MSSTHTPTQPTDSEEPRSPRTVPRYVALILFALVLVMGGLAIYSAAEAADAAQDAEILMDGVDRSRLPREEAVAIAVLARERSEPVPEDAKHDHGHDHGDHDHELTPAEEAQLEAQWQEAVDAVDRFDSLEKVEAAGYVLASGVSDGAGAHYVKWSAVDRPFDPAEPSMLLFEELVRGEEPELIAYSYWVTSDEEPVGFAGEQDTWHQHLGVCFINGWIKDENLQRDECVGDWVNGMDMWMLHAWVVPGLENEYGRFHTVNPLLCEHACGLEN